MQPIEFHTGAILESSLNAKIQGWYKMNEKIDRLKKVVDRAICMAVQYGGIDGDYHKAWVIDQMVRILAGDKYDQIVKDACDGEDGPDTYRWSIGIAP